MHHLLKKMSNTIEIIADLIGEASHTDCPECVCGYNADACGFDVTPEGLYYIEYCCEECYSRLRYRWVPKDLENQSDEEMFDANYVFDFDKLRYTILKAKGKFATLKAFLDYYELDYEGEGYTIPQIYNNLKNKNYVRRQAYILYKLGSHLFECKKNGDRFAAIRGEDNSDQRGVYLLSMALTWLYRADFLIYLESSQQQVNKHVSEIVDNSDLRRYITEYI